MQTWKKIDSINIDCDYEKVKGFTSMKSIELSSTNINRLIKKILYHFVCYNYKIWESKKTSKEMFSREFS